MRQYRVGEKSVVTTGNWSLTKMATNILAARMLRMLLAATVLASISAAVLATAGLAQAQNDKIDGEWCRETRSFKVNRENVTTYHGSQVTAEYDGDGLGVRYIAPANEPEAGSEITVVLRTPEMAYLLRRAKGTTGYGERERWQRCKITS